MEMDSEVSMELQNIHQKPELIKSANTRFKVKLSANTKLALIIFAIWFLAALHSLPHTVFNRVKTIRVLNKMHTDGNRTLSEEELNARTVTVRRCIPVWPKELGTNFNLYLTIFTTITQYFIPLSCAGFIYLRIALTVQQLGKVGEISRGKAEQLTKKKRRRLLMLFFSFACFALSWAPFQIYYLLLDFGVTKTTNYVSFLSVLWVATSSVCWNPCVLAFFNESFKAEAKAVLQRLKSCCTYGG